VDENRVATIANERVIVVWNTFNGDLICSFDTKALKDPLCGIALDNNQIFSWSKSAIFAHGFYEIKGLKTTMKKHFDEVGIESLSSKNEFFFGFDGQNEGDILTVLMNLKMRFTVTSSEFKSAKTSLSFVT
jgi:hypothetical protein